MHHTPLPFFAPVHRRWRHSIAAWLLAGAAPLAWAATPPEAACLPLAGDLATGVQAERHQAADGTCLQAYAWAPAAGPARGVVVLVHGIRDHAQRYGALAEALAASGIAVVAQDHRGHGHSGGPRQRFDSVEQLMGDLDLAIEQARRQYPGLPLFLFGHSMGGLVVTHYTLAHPGAAAGVVLSGPALRLGADATAGKRFAVQLLGRIWPSLAIQPVDDSLFVREPSAKRAQASDPLIAHDKLPAASALTFLRGIEAYDAAAVRFDAPLLAMHGEADVSTDPEGSRDLVARAASRDKTLRIVPLAMHDLLHEPEAPQLVREIVAWVGQHIR
jgi:alpha-beta hydrolase superfamily lysophospholipase